MHVQVKSPLKSAAFADEVEDESGSVDYPQASARRAARGPRRGSDRGIRRSTSPAASGHDIELGGEFAFWVDAARRG